MGHTNGNGNEPSLRQDLGALLEGQDLTPEQEMQAFLGAKRAAVRRARLVALRLALVLSAVTAAVVLWYAWSPIPTGVYPAKVLGGAYNMTEPDGGIRFPVMWVKAHPFQRRPPSLAKFELKDQDGRTVAIGEGVEITLDAERGLLPRRVQGWVTLQPAESGGVACTALIGITPDSAQVFDIGVLRVLGDPGPSQGPIADLGGANLIFPGYGPQGRMWVELTLVSTRESTQLVGARTGEFAWLDNWNTDVYEIVPVPLATKTPLDSQVMIFGGPNEVFDWRPAELPIDLPQYGYTRVALRLASWAGTLAQDYFLYVPVQLEVLANGTRQGIMTTAVDYGWERPWGMFQTMSRWQPPARL